MELLNYRIIQNSKSRQALISSLNSFKTCSAYQDLTQKRSSTSYLPTMYFLNSVSIHLNFVFPGFLEYEALPIPCPSLPVRHLIIFSACGVRFVFC